MSEAFCDRCGKPCQSGVGNPEARLLKRAISGLCADCAITQFLKFTEPVNTLVSDPAMLRSPHVREQIARLLIVGKSDAGIGEIDIEKVITNWNLPFKKIRKV